MCGLLLAGLAAAEPLAPRCLIINSYHPTYLWTDDQSRGVVDSLVAAGIPAAEVAVEYLDAKRIPDLFHGQAFAQLLERKYRLREVGCVMVTDNAALDYCVALRPRQLAGVPIVFSGINGFSPGMLREERRITGVVEVMDIVGTLRLAMRLHPQARQVVVVHDGTVTGLNLRKEFDSAWTGMGAPLRLRALTGLSFAELEAELRRLDTGSLVLLLSFASDRERRVVEQSDEAGLISAICGAPLWAVHENRLGHGIVGGMLFSGREHGAQAGRLVAAILGGQDADTIPVQQPRSSRPMFDHRQLVRWGLREDALPSGSRVVNIPPTLWRDYRWQALGALGIGLSLVATIAAMAAIAVARRRASLRLAASERFLEETQQVSLTGSFQHDLAGGLVRGTGTLDAILGLPPGRAHPIREWLDLAHEEDRPALHRHYAAVVDGSATTLDHVHRVQTRDGGGLRWVRIMGRLDRDAGGRALRVIGTLQDITSRRQAEDALRSSELRFREVLDHLPIPVRVIDREGRVVLLNRAFTQRFGYAIADVPTIDRWWIAAYPDLALRERIRQHWQRTIAEVGPDRVSPPLEVALECKGGGERRVVVETGTFGDLLVTSFLDVTEQRRAQDELAAAATQWQTTFDAVRDPLWLLDADQRILRSNRAADELMRTLGRPVAGRHCWEVAHGTAGPIPDCPVGRARRSLRRETGETRIGERLYEVIADPVLDAGGAYAGCVHLVSDITEMRRLEEGIRHTEKMNAIGQLAGGVAHDFNNQLAGIMGYAELLLRRLADAEQRHFAQGILTAAQRSADLTRQLLAFARKGRYLRVPVDLHAVVAETVGILSHAIDRRIAIERRCAAARSLVLGDPSQLQSALLNLGVNARDAMAEGGTMSFATEVAGPGTAPSDLPPGDYLHLAVSDTGCGMTEEVRSHLFEPFFTTKGAGKGTGMGLAAVYGTVRNHGGAVTVDTAPGQGTTFHLYLPLAAAAAEAPAAETGQEPGRRRLRILVVDDEAVVRELLADLLGEDGHEVLVAEDGRAALVIYRDRWASIDLVVLDMIMPGMDGRACFRAMKEVNPQVKVLLASGFSLDGQAQELLAEGVGGFLNKPFSAAELRQALAQLCGS